MKKFGAIVLLTSTISALDNGLGLVPQMGWNSWNKFACNVNETLIQGMADTIVEKGLDKLGYTYVNIDDCWQEEQRTDDGHVVVSDTFPSGMKSMGDYLHAKGLNFGLYSSAGTNTCQGRAGSLGFEKIDAQDYASWGVDYLKYDNCFNNGIPGTLRYPIMRDALNATGRPIFYSICSWGDDNVATWGGDVGNSWRTTTDIQANFDSIRSLFYDNYKAHEDSGPGGWNDPDMLEIGNGDLTVAQERTHFALWSMSKAPLLIGADLNNIKNESLEILMADEVIAINQDPRTKQARCVLGCSFSVEEISVLISKISSNEIAVSLSNWSSVDKKPYSLTLSDLGIAPKSGTKIKVRDLFAKKDVAELIDMDDQGVFITGDMEMYNTYLYKFTVTDDQVNFLQF